MFNRFVGSSRGVRILCIVGATLGLAGIAFLLFRTVISPRPEIDFRFFWLAGKAWSMGLDPYSPVYEQLGAAILPDGNKVIHWFYPPQWWAVCRLLAMTDLSQALMVWRLASGAMVLGATAILVRCVVERPAELRWGLIGLACGFAALIEPTANLLALGQSSGVVYLCLTLFVAGILSRSRWLVGAALFLATFKPQVGAGLLLATLFIPRYRGTALAALGAAGLLTLPHTAVFGPLSTIREFLGNLQQWSALPSNTPLASSGPTNLLARLGVSGLTMNVQMAAAYSLLCYAGWCLRRTLERPLEPLYLIAASLVALVPLHIYDFTIIMVPLILHLAIARRPTWIAMLTLLAVIRPGRIEELLGIPQYGSSGLILLDIVSLLLLADAVWRWQTAVTSSTPAAALSRPPGS